MSWNLVGIRKKVQGRLQNDPFFTDGQVNEAINDAIDDLVTFTRYPQVVYQPVGGSVVGLKEYVLPLEFLYVNQATYDGFKMEEMSQDDWIRDGGERSTMNGIPRRFFVPPSSPLKVVLYPAANTPGKTISLYVVQKPPDLLNDNDIPVIPRHFSQSIIEYCLYTLLLQDASLEGEGREQDADLHYKLYLKRRSEVNFQLNFNNMSQARRRI